MQTLSFKALYHFPRAAQTSKARQSPVLRLLSQYLDMYSVQSSTACRHSRTIFLPSLNHNFAHYRPHMKGNMYRSGDSLRSPHWRTALHDRGGRVLLQHFYFLERLSLHRHWCIHSSLLGRSSTASFQSPSGAFRTISVSTLGVLDLIPKSAALDIA